MVASGDVPPRFADRGELEAHLLDQATHVGLGGRLKVVAAKYASGTSAKRVAYRLGLKENTVRSYLKQVFARVGATSRAELLLALLAAGRASNERERY